MRWYIIALLAILKVQGQVVFCPAGAEWSAVYNMFGALQANMNVKIKYSGDSLLGTDIVKKLEHKNFFYNCNDNNTKITLIKQIGDTVFFRNKFTQHQWEILFNYAAVAGQSWKTKYLDATNTQKTYTVTVNLVDQVIENGKTLRRLHVQHSSAGARIIAERYGWEFLFAYNTTGCVFTDSHWFGQSLCYKDDGFGIKKFNSLGCDYQNPVNTDEPTGSEPQINVMPNPTMGSEVRITVHNASEMALQFHIFNGMGQLVDIIENNHKNEILIPASKYINGIYTIVAYDESRVICKKKVAVIQ